MGDNCRIQECREEFKEIHTSIKGVESYMAKIDKTLAINTQSLQQHMRRTELLETQVGNHSKFMYLALGAWAVVQIIIPFILK